MRARAVGSIGSIVMGAWCPLLFVWTVTACTRAVPPTHDETAPPASEGVQFVFEDGDLGGLPPDFSPALTGGGGAVDWRLEEADDAPSGARVVAQRSADRTNRRYPLLVCDEIDARDVDVSVRFKTISGEVDASAGLFWRGQDADNYYVARANSLEGNVVAYKTIAGERSSIGVGGEGDAYGVDADVPHEVWNSLRVIARGRRFEIFLNGRKLFEVDHDEISNAGTVGLWTKADAVTQFDDLTVTSLDPE